MTGGAVWPVDLVGVVESVTTTPGPNGRWNVAALGLRAADDHEPDQPAGARTWGRTRTRASFEREGRGYAQFVRDPLVFVDAALDVRESEGPILAEAAAWVEFDARAVDDGHDGGTEWVDWELTPLDSAVRRRDVPVTDRGYAAVVEMTVAASRLGVREYDDDVLEDRLDYFASVARTCGGPAVRAAVDRIASLVDWQPDPAGEDGGVTRDHAPE